MLNSLIIHRAINMQLQVGATEKPIFPNNYNKTVYYQIKKLNLIYNNVLI